MEEFMKKAVVFIILGLLFVGCGKEYYSVSIKNNSSKTASYVYDGISDTLTVSEVRVYEVKAYTQPPKKIVDQNGIASLRMEQKGDNFTFTDASPLNLNVINKLPVNVKIKANNYIDDNGSIELAIGANTEKTTAKIYTSSPNFVSLIEYPVIIDWNFADDTIYVVVR